MLAVAGETEQEGKEDGNEGGLPQLHCSEKRHCAEKWGGGGRAELQPLR